jgi:hypothetical protein
VEIEKCNSEVDTKALAYGELPNGSKTNHTILRTRAEGQSYFIFENKKCFMNRVLSSRRNILVLQSGGRTSNGPTTLALRKVVKTEWPYNPNYRDLDNSTRALARGMFIPLWCPGI